MWDYNTKAGKYICNYSRNMFRDEHISLMQTILFAFRMVGYIDDVLDSKEFTEEIERMAENFLIWRHGTAMSPKSVTRMLYGSEGKAKDIPNVPNRQHSAKVKQVLKQQRYRR